MKETIFFGVMQFLSVHAAILPPPWADPELNPCASQPGGWLKVFWPPDGKCYRIFHRGYPCPETMELNPVQEGLNQITAECRCPPRTAQISISDVCYPINTQGPCERGEYFTPLRLSPPARQRVGHCIKAKQCGPEKVFWPATNQCYEKLIKGPCPDGQLLHLNKNTQLGECECLGDGMAQHYWSSTKTCHQHYTKGPCLEKGTLFLPGPTCGCDRTLPNYDPTTNKCYEIGTMGPCKAGHLFNLEPPKLKATCNCKPEHVLWEDGQCYRVYTRGPCQPGAIIFANHTCSSNPCSKGKLYFPEDGSCHRVGVKGPCAKGQLVLFEQSIKPSLEGVSYRGMCGCSGPERCRMGETRNEMDSSKLESRSDINDVGKSKSNIKNVRNGHNHLKETSSHSKKICEKREKPQADNCYALYSQGPCSQGEWLVPARQGRTARQYHRFGCPEATLLRDEYTQPRARCECRPGYSKPSMSETCRLLLVSLANFF